MIKSNLDVAYDIMQNKEGSFTFKELWEEICKIQGYDEEESKKRMGKFYTNLFMDGRFITLGENVWDLRDRYTFDRVHIDMNDVYRDDDEEDEEDDEEENEDILEKDEDEEDDDDEEKDYDSKEEDY